MKNFWQRKRGWALAFALLATASARAGELALYHFPSAQVEYEGTGHRQVQNGWELKVKPKNAASGLRWRHDLSDTWAFQAQYWRNQPAYDREDGNTRSRTQRQTGRTRLAVHNFLADLRRPLRGSPVEAVAGLQGVRESFERKDIVFNGSPEPARPRETLSAAGAYMGFHGARRGNFYWDWEALFGHFFFTGNEQKASGGSIRRNGYSYALRLEAGLAGRSWRAGVGLVRQLLQIHVPGGKALASGAAASLPLNKTDISGLALSVTYAY
jgi:hypothetical protein